MEEVGRKGTLESGWGLTPSSLLDFLILDVGAETASSAWVEGGKIVASAQRSGRQFAEQFSQLLDEVFEQPGAGSESKAGPRRARCCAVVCGLGPGSYTGARSGASASIALGQFLDVPVLGLGNLLASAMGALGALHDQQVSLDATTTLYVFQEMNPQEVVYTTLQKRATLDDASPTTPQHCVDEWEVVGSCVLLSTSEWKEFSDSLQNTSISPIMVNALTLSPLRRLEGFARIGADILRSAQLSATAEFDCAAHADRFKGEFQRWSREARFELLYGKAYHAKTLVDRGLASVSKSPQVLVAK